MNHDGFKTGALISDESVGIAGTLAIESLSHISRRSYALRNESRWEDYLFDVDVPNG